MTKDEVYEYYLHWRKGSRTLSVEELFSAYTIDQNIFESSSKVINRLFYLVPDFFKSNLRIFIFYEENTFLKDSKQISKQFLDLTLCNSANGGKACIYGLFRHLLYGRTIRI